MQLSITKRLALGAIARGLPVPEQHAHRVLELVQLKRLIGQLDINCVLDVGANRGQFASELRGIGFRGMIASFEPLRSEFSRISEAFRDDPRWRGFQMALGDASGTATINVIPDMTVMSSLLKPELKWREVRAEEVQIRRLDDVFTDAVRGVDSPRVLLKMDTQGYDLRVFEGAGRSLSHILALQSEVSVVPIYQGMPRYYEAVARYEHAGFELVNVSVVSRSDEGRLIELNCLMRRVAHGAQP